MHPRNSFITLTYDEQNLKNPKLDYEEFQLFMKRLRKTQNDPIGHFTTGEYGEKSGRKHWHTLLFNYMPGDAVPSRKTERGDQIFSSKILESLWPKGRSEIGLITFESAGYTARYAAKKLTFGHDGTHDFEPISKKSNKNAIGKKWIERWYESVFTQGNIILPDGNTCSIPRYYEKWLKENQPARWLRYVTTKKLELIQHAEETARKENTEYWNEADQRPLHYPPTLHPQQIKAEINLERFNRLKQTSKL